MLQIMLHNLVDLLYQCCILVHDNVHRHDLCRLGLHPETGGEFGREWGHLWRIWSQGCGSFHVFTEI